jgi:hypothetical protein
MKRSRILFLDDERLEGNSIIVTLKYGWEFGTDLLASEHVRGFDTMAEVSEGVNDAIPCVCEDCLKNIMGGN